MGIFTKRGPDKSDAIGSTIERAAPKPAEPAPLLVLDLASEPPPQPSIADTFERMLSDDVDAGFAALGAPTGAATLHASATDLGEVRELFAQLAANHVRPVRDFMIDLRSGQATAEWIAICLPALRSLRRAADKLDFASLCEALDRLSEELATLQAAGVSTIEGERRTSPLARYEELVALMPQAFALDLDRSQRETVILQSLLMQVADVRKVTIDRLCAAGLTTLEAMFLATPGDIAATAGISEQLASRIVERFRAYRQQVTATVPDATRAAERERLAELAVQLRKDHDGFERASESCEAGALDQKRSLRKARAQTLLDIQVLLARLGEIERLAELERLPFEKKVARVEAFLDEARDKYAREP